MRNLSKKEIKNLMKTHKNRDFNIVIILENIEYARNIASIFRTADAAGIKFIYLTGVSNHPPFGKELVRVSRHKEKSIQWQYYKNSISIINKLKLDDFYIFAIELTDKSKPFYSISLYKNKIKNICFVFGSEVFGINKKTLALCNDYFYIPMHGKGSSLNVSVSVGVILFSLDILL